MGDCSIEGKKQQRKSIKPKVFYLKEINKIDKPPARLIKGKRKNIQILNVKNIRRDSTTDTIGIKKVIRKYYEKQ